MEFVGIRLCSENERGRTCCQNGAFDRTDGRCFAHGRAYDALDKPRGFSLDDGSRGKSKGYVETDPKPRKRSRR